MISKLDIKRTLGASWKHLPKETPRRVVLLYHSVGKGDWAIPESEFAKQMEWLAGQTRVLSLVQALESEADQVLEVAITFDDGYASVFDRAFPIMRSLGLTSAIFLNTAHIGQQEHIPSDSALGHYPGEAFLRWAEVDALLEAGWIAGSHGDRHFDLTTFSDTVAMEQLRVSKDKLESVTSLECRYFSYTWGRHTRKLRELVKKVGYVNGLAGIHGPVSAVSDPYAVCRINISQSYSLDDFIAIVKGDWDYLGHIQRWLGRAQ